MALLAEAAAPARRDAGDEYAIVLGEGRHAIALGDDGADGLVAEDRAGDDLGHVALQDVQVGSADRGGIDAHDDVGWFGDRRVSDALPATLAGTVIDERFHRVLLSFDSSDVARDRDRAIVSGLIRLRLIRSPVGLGSDASGPSRGEDAGMSAESKPGSTSTGSRSARAATRCG